VLGAAAPAASAQEVDHLQAFLVARGDDYFIHVVPATPGHMLVHTIPSSGVMKPFFVAGPPVDVAPHRGVEPVEPGEVRIVGLASDNERLYVVARRRANAGDCPSGSATESPPTPENPAAPAPLGRDSVADPTADPVQIDITADPPAADRFFLMVFWQQDASLVQRLELTVPADRSAPEPTLGRGPLRIVEGGVSAFDSVYTFDGRILSTIRTPDGREFTPPPQDPDDRFRNL
jgi:hypothetical protein